MLVSHRREFIYTKTFKTASTSVEAYFEPYCLPPGETWTSAEKRDLYQGETGIIGQRTSGAWQQGYEWFDHMHAAQIKSQLAPEIWNSYFKFCVVRNTYDYLVSAFHFFTSRELDRYKPRFWNKLGRTLRGKNDTFDTWTRHSEQQLFRRWLRKGLYPAQDTQYAINGKYVLDYCIRYDCLLEGVAEVCRRIDVPFEPERLAQYHSGIRPKSQPLAAYYDEASVDFVRQRFAFEIETFNFKSPLEEAT
ncbi:MAG: hypothetical protein AAGK14_08350 [Verrucomicrobiota bacterium]